MHQTPVQISWQGAAYGTPLPSASTGQTGADILDYLKGRGGKIKELEDAVAEQRAAKEQLAQRLQQAEQQVRSLEMRLQAVAAVQPAHAAQQGSTPSHTSSSVYVADLERLLKEQLQRVLQLEQELSAAKEQLASQRAAAQAAQAFIFQTKEDADRRVREAQATTAALQRDLTLLHGECVEQVARAERTAMLEGQRAAAAVELQQTTVHQLREAQERLAVRDQAGERLAAAESRIHRLESENDELASQVAALQEKLGRGQFGSNSNMRVLHLRMNPEAEYHKQMAHGQAGELQAKVDALTASLSQVQAALSAMEARALAAEASATSTGRHSHMGNGHATAASGLGTSELMSQLAASEAEVAVLKHKMGEADKASARLRAVFKERAAVFREAMYCLFGYRVDMTSEATTASAAGSAPTTFSLRPQHADSSDSLLVFRYTPEEGMTLVPTPFTTGRLAREVDTFVRRFKCIPAFTANLTMESFQKQTQC